MSTSHVLGAYAPARPQPPFQTRTVHVSIMNRFGAKLRVLRRNRNYTQMQLADYLGIDRSFISEVENGHKAISLPFLEVIADGFKMPLSELMSGL